MSTQVTYNGILLDAVRTRAYERQHIHTPDGCDYLHTRHALHLEGMFSPYLNSYNSSGVAASGQAPYVTDMAIRRKLLAKRKTLTVTINGNTWLLSPKAGYTEDVNRGPRPLYCNVTRVDGAGALMVQWGVETCLDENVSAASNPLRSCRWSQSDDIDENYQTVRTTAGTAIFGGDVLAARNRSADADRVQFWPPVPRFMKRERCNISLSEDGRIITYRVVDAEKVIPGGKLCPLLRWDAYYTASGNPSAASTGQQAFRGMVQVNGSGATTVPQWYLLTTAIGIAMSKLRSGGGGAVIPQGCTATMALHARQITLHAEAVLTPPRVLLGGLPIDDWRFGQTAHEQDMAIAFGPFGSYQSEAPVMPGDGSRGTFAAYLKEQMIRDDFSQNVERLHL